MAAKKLLHQLTFPTKGQIQKIQFQDTLSVLTSQTQKRWTRERLEPKKDKKRLLITEKTEMRRQVDTPVRRQRIRKDHITEPVLELAPDEPRVRGQRCVQKLFPIRVVDDLKQDNTGSYHDQTIQYHNRLVIVTAGVLVKQHLGFEPPILCGQCFPKLLSPDSQLKKSFDGGSQAAATYSVSYLTHGWL